MHIIIMYINTGGKGGQKDGSIEILKTVVFNERIQ